jgi:hypothetical protein
MKDMFVKIWDNFSSFLKSRDPRMSSYYIEFWVNSLILMNKLYENAMNLLI